MTQTIGITIIALAAGLWIFLARALARWFRAILPHPIYAVVALFVLAAAVFLGSFFVAGIGIDLIWPLQTATVEMTGTAADIIVLPFYAIASLSAALANLEEIIYTSFGLCAVFCITYLWYLFRPMKPDHIIE